MNQRLSRRSKREQQQPRQTSSRPKRPANAQSPSSGITTFFILVGIGGLLLLAWPLMSLKTIYELGGRQTLLTTLPDVATAAPGDLAILDGRVGVSVPTLHDEFVAYVRERGQSGKYVSSAWQYVDGAQQPLAVETGERSFRFANDTYRFDRLLWNWTDAERWDEEATTLRGAIRIQGIVANGPVMAVGRIKPDEGGEPVFEADSVVGISRADYMQRLDARYGYEWKFAGTVFLMALIGMAVGWVGVRRYQQE